MNETKTEMARKILFGEKKELIVSIEIYICMCNDYLQEKCLCASSILIYLFGRLFDGGFWFLFDGKEEKTILKNSKYILK